MTVLLRPAAFAALTWPDVAASYTIHRPSFSWKHHAPAGSGSSGSRRTGRRKCERTLTCSMLLRSIACDGEPGWLALRQSGTCCCRLSENAASIPWLSFCL